jgi:transcriptional regulator with XRE-family HTH domain
MERNFRKILRDELDYHGLTVKELAAKTSVAKGAINSYLGKQSSMPPADVAVKLAAALGVTVEYLVNGHDKSRETPVTFFFQVPKSAHCFVFLVN